MSEDQIVPIQDSFDIIEARVQVRNLARALGFDLFDQARISLATSTLAYILGLGREAGGQISLQRYQGEDQVGVRVVCYRARAMNHEIPSGVLEDARHMVDELVFEVLPSGETRITLVKWPGKTALGMPQAAESGSPPRHSML